MCSFKWCPPPDLNRDGFCNPQDFKSCASTNSARRAKKLLKKLILKIKILNYYHHLKEKIQKKIRKLYLNFCLYIIFLNFQLNKELKARLESFHK